MHVAVAAVVVFAVVVVVVVAVVVAAVVVVAVVVVVVAVVVVALSDRLGSSQSPQSWHHCSSKSHASLRMAYATLSSYLLGFRQNWKIKMEKMSIYTDNQQQMTMMVSFHFDYCC